MTSIRLACLCVALGLAPVLVTHVQADVGGDSSANYATSTWTNGSTEGMGFGPWVLTGTSVNLFITNPVLNSGAANFAALASNNTAFGLYLNATAARTFSSPLQANERFTISLGHKWDGGTRGLNLYKGTAGSSDQIFFFRINAANLAWGATNQIGTNPTIPWGSGKRDAGALYNLTFTKTADGFTYEIASPHQSPNLIASGAITNNQPLAGFAAYISSGDTDQQGAFYLNHLSVVALNIADNDGDGLTDSWETNYFGDLSQNGNGDPDGDTLSNAQELTKGTNPTLADTDDDGLGDDVETKTGTYVSVSDTGTDPILADTDGDGYADGAEVAGTSAFGMVSSPLKKNYSRITIPNGTLAPTWDAAGAIAMTRIDQFTYRYSNLQLTPSFQFKLTAGDWATDWGVDGSWTPGATSGKAKRQGGLPNFVPGLSGIYDVTFNHDTLDVTFSPPGFPEYNDFALAFNLLGADFEDDDADGLSNTGEWQAGTDPTNPDTDGDGLADSSDPAPKSALMVTDGARDEGYTNRTGILANAPMIQSVQTTVALSDSNNLANLSALQVGGKLRLFIGGTPQNTQPAGETGGDKFHYLVFLDSKAGGISQVQTNTSTTANAGDAAQINVLGGMKFDAGFTPDYCVKISGGSQNAWINLHDLQTGGHQYIGESAKGIVSGGIIAAAKSSFQAASPAPYGGVSQGSELVLDLAAMGVDLSVATPGAVKMLVILASNPDLNSTPISDYSNGFNQTLPPVAAGVDGNLKNVDFSLISGDQFLTFQPRALPQITLTGAPLLWTPDLLVEVFPDDPGAVSALPVNSNYNPVRLSFDTAIAGTAKTVTYLVVDPDTGWYATATRRLFLGIPQLTEAFIQYPTSSETIGTLQTYNYYIQTKGVGVTDDPGAPNATSFPHFKAQLGYALATVVDGQPYDAANWTWVDGTYNARPSATDGRDEYRVPLVGLAPGSYKVVSRFTVDSSVATPVWLVGDISNPGPMGSSPAYGVLTVTGSQLTEAFIAYPMNTTNSPNTISQAQTYGYYFQTKGLGVTDPAGAPDTNNFPRFKAQLGIAPVAVAGQAFQPADWTWLDGTYNDRPAAADGRDEYSVAVSPITQNLAPGDYVTVVRFTLDSGATVPDWVYGDLNQPGPVGAVPTYGGLSVTAPAVGFAQIQFPTAPTPIQVGESLDVYFQFWSEGITSPAGEPTWSGVRAQLGYGTAGGDPSVVGAYTWIDGSYNIQNGNNDEYQATLGGLSAGNYFYACRFSVDGGITWIYGGTAGIWNNDSASLSVQAVGSTFAGWAGGGALTNSANVGKYAIGGASSLSATDGVAPTSALSGGNLVLTAIVRTDDTNLTVVGEAVTSLTDYGTPASVTAVNGSTNGVSQAGVPTGHQKQAFTTAQDGARKFLRLKATLAP